MKDLKLDNTFLFIGNSTFILELHDKWIKNPNSVSQIWSDWFNEIGHQMIDDQPSWKSNKTKVT